MNQDPKQNPLLPKLYLFLPKLIQLPKALVKLLPVKLWQLPKAKITLKREENSDTERS